MAKTKKKKSPNARLLASEKNLAKGAPYRWPRGVSGNPSGRPPALFSKACRDKLAELVPGDPHERTFAELIADMLGQKAILGDLYAAAELADRAEGKSKTTMDVNDGRGDPLGDLIEEFRLARAESETEETIQ